MPKGDLESVPDILDVLAAFLHTTSMRRLRDPGQGTKYIIIYNFSVKEVLTIPLLIAFYTAAEEASYRSIYDHSCMSYNQTYHENKFAYCQAIKPELDFRVPMEVRDTFNLIRFARDQCHIDLNIE